MKVAVISYHKNATKIYPQMWLDRHVKSVIEQTYKDFDIFELDYGGGKERLFENSYFFSLPLPSFVNAMIFLLDYVFEHGYDVAANLNCDDWYSKRRLAVQLPYIKKGYDIVSCNFTLIKNEKVYLAHYFDKLDIANELRRNNNIIAHPAVIYSKNFWQHNRYRPEEIPVEDMLLWKRALALGFKIKIVPNFLLYHIIHENSVCKSENR